MIEKLKGNLLDIYSIMEQGPYVRTIDDDYFSKFEVFEKSNKSNDIVLIEDHRKNSKGEYGVFSWTTYSNIAKSLAKFLLINTGFLENCGTLASIRYNVPYTYFDYNVEYDYEHELTKVIKKYFSKELEEIVYGFNSLFNVINSQEKINVLSLERIYEFINLYRALVYLFVDHIFAGDTYKDEPFLIGANDHNKGLHWMRNPLKMNYETDWF